MTGPQRKFCEGVVSGMAATDAYAAAYPNSAPANARKNACRLTANDGIKAEIVRLRALAATAAGSAAMTLADIRMGLAAIVRCKTGALNGSKILTSDRVAACKLDAALAGFGKDAEATHSMQDAIGQMLRRVMIK